MSQYDASRSPEPSGWAVGGVGFAAVIMLMIGIFGVIQGIAAIIEDEFFVIGAQYAYNLDVSGMGLDPPDPRPCPYLRRVGIVRR